MHNSILTKDLKFSPLTLDRWPDLESLFGSKGACSCCCWCMWWRLKRSEFEVHKGDNNKKAFKKIVDSGSVPGIIAYYEKQPVVWCSFGPRENYPVLERSRILKPIDDQEVWSVVCFFIAKGFQKKGISVELLKAVINYAKQKGVKILEGYPIEPKKQNMPSVFAWTGFSPAFLKAGFKEVLRRSETRPIMRYYF